MTSCLHACLAQPPPKVLLLDGATGTELERRGLRTSLPLWTATASRDAPALLRAVHDDYVQAGADMLTACTFRTTRYTLSKSGLGDDARRLTFEAVAVARASASAAKRPVLVAGSIAPLEDCYRADRTPDDATLHVEHRLHVDALQKAGVDALLVETMPTLREALIAGQAAVSTGLPTIISLLPGSETTLFDGTALDEAFTHLSALPVALLALNCASAARCSLALHSLARVGTPFGAYANTADPDGSFGREPATLDENEYAEVALGWLALGASLLGGCCGTRPSHIARLRTLLDQHAHASQGHPAPEQAP